MTLFHCHNNRTPPPQPTTAKARGIDVQRLLGCFAHRFAILVLLSTGQVHAANQAPSANAGSDQNIGVNTLVQLSGSQSSDSDGSIKSYLWKQLKGQKVKLSNPKLATPSFTTPASLPSKLLDRTLIFKLTVSDNKNKKASDTVTINLLTCIAPKVLINNSCQAPAPVCYPPNSMQNGECLPPPALTCNPPLAAISGACRLPPVTCTLPEVVENGVCAIPFASPFINDTGVTLCSDTDKNGDFCPIGNYPGQDAEFGRDKLFNDDHDGHAGFSFSKIDVNGAELPISATEWSCVKDNVTGLIWENKTTDGGLHDKDKLYSFYSEEYDPTAEYQSATDASGLVSAVNSIGLCGASDWRIPTTEELQGIVDYSVVAPGPSIDKGFFIASNVDKEFWSSTAYAADATQGWVVYFNGGLIWNGQRNQHYRLRLVRSGQSNLSR